MKHYDAILIRPMRFGGVFGIAKELRKRGAGVYWYTLLLVLACAALYALALLPGALSFIKILPEIIADEHSFEFHGAWSMFGGMLLSALLWFLAWVAYTLLIAPIFTGALYTELSARLYGDASGAGEMLHRSGFMLKRYFTTALCAALAAMGVSFVASIVGGLIGAVGQIFVLLPAALSAATGSPLAMGVSAGIAALLLSLLAGAAGITCGMFLSLIYPAAVNENLRNFQAVGRSITMVGKGFLRAWCVHLTYYAIAAGLILALLIASVLLGVFAHWIAGVAFGVLGAVALGCFLTPYGMALNTALYFDLRARQGVPAPPAQAAQDQPVQPENTQTAPEQPEYTQTAPKQPEYAQPAQNQSVQEEQDPYAQAEE